MVTQQVPDTDEMPFGEDLEGLNFDDEEEDGETVVGVMDPEAASDETSAEVLGEEAEESDLDAELRQLLAEQAKHDEAVRKAKEAEAKIKQLKKEKERLEQEIKEFTCPSCGCYHPETKIARPTVVSSGRGRGSGKAFPDDIRMACAMIVGELRVQGKNQSQIGKVLSETFPEVYEDASNSSVRFGTVVGQILKSGSGAWANVTGFTTSVETYSERSMSEIEAMTQKIAPQLSTEHSALVEQVASL